ncbi:hypothetical protein QN277_000661 [Acacia crassicarpa]|uniref:Kinesin motor domain-containing protein n=1 Tax=Acacia crassicarpa TaxID=499986 RepID=A0AAE1N6Z6_9FABA|nr:hypothetical protein QN277_000661 [Acacia crassicarpa]
MRKNDDDQVFLGGLTHGLLDLHSFNTERLQSSCRSFDDSEPFSSVPVNKARGLPETNLKSLSADKERAYNFAKIKVLVRKRPLNKKE